MQTVRLVTRFLFNWNTLLLVKFCKNLDTEIIIHKFANSTHVSHYCGNHLRWWFRHIFINIILIKQDKHRHRANSIFSTQKSRDITSLGKHVGNRQPAQWHLCQPPPAERMCEWDITLVAHKRRNLRQNDRTHSVAQPAGTRISRNS